MNLSKRFPKRLDKMIRNKMKSKNGQEEMIGFVLIIVIVAIVGVIFLGIMIRTQDSNLGSKSEKINSLIGSLSQITTKCEIPESKLKNVSELIEECTQVRLCSTCNGETCGTTSSSCEVLENTLRSAMAESYVVSGGSYVRYYNLSVYYKFDDALLIEPIISGEAGKCPGTKLFSDRGFEDIELKLEVCFNDE